MAALEAAALRRTSQAAYDEQLKAGYIKGIKVDRPTVISVNMQAAAAAVNVFLARIHAYRVMPNKTFAIRRLCLRDPDANEDKEEGSACPVMSRSLGTGDQLPFLGMPNLGD